MTIRKEMTDLLDALGLDPVALRLGKSDLSGVYEFEKVGKVYWFVRCDGTACLCIDGRKVTVQYADPAVTVNCPARWPRRFMIEETFSGREWEDRLIEFIAPFLPELIQTIAYGSNISPEDCNSSMWYVPDSNYMITQLQKHFQTLWLRKGGDWNKLNTPAPFAPTAP